MTKKEENAEAERKERIAELGREQSARAGVTYEEVEGVPPSADAVAQQEALEEAAEQQAEA